MIRCFSYEVPAKMQWEIAWDLFSCFVCKSKPFIIHVLGKISTNYMSRLNSFNQIKVFFSEVLGVNI